MMQEPAAKAGSAGNRLSLEARCYHDPAIYEAERQKIFKSEWLVFGHEAMVREQGSYMAYSIAGWPLFVIRDKAGELKGFHNVCRHRGAMVLKEGMGKTAVLRCMYHGWVYDTDGKLCKAPDFGGDEESLCARMKLFPIHVRTYKGLVFICMAETPPDFEESLGDFKTVIKDWGIEDYEFYTTEQHPIKCNWKTYVENYMEGYHIPDVHPGLNKVVDMKTYRVTPHDRIALHETDTKDKTAAHKGLWVWMWPHAALNIYQNGMNLELMIPTGPETVELKYFYLFQKPDDGKRAEAVEASAAVTAEDVTICEIVQKNLRAGIYQQGELSPRHENGVAYFQDLVRAALHS